MSRHWVEVRLTVPDATAFTALAALRRLGIDISRVERGSVYGIDSSGSDAALLESVRSDVSRFNINLHDARTRDGVPGEGEMFVREVGPSTSLRYARDDSGGYARDDTFVVWRLFDEEGRRVSREVLERARDALLCNAACEEAELPE